MQIASNHTTEVWKRRLSAALRIAIACTIVGGTTLYGPTQIRNQIGYPAFAYVTAILIVSESTLGKTLRGAWQAVIGTCLVLGPAILSLKLVGPSRFTPDVMAVAVAIGAFGVALWDSTSIFSKRLAFGQLVLVYVGAYIKGVETDVVMHPFHVAASTGTGALASILAMLLPLPRCATYEVTKKCRKYGEIAAERLNLCMKVFAVEQIPAGVDSAAEAKTLAEKASRLLQTIEKHHDGIVWEKPQIRLLTTQNLKPVERLQDIEKSLRGMEMALASYSKNLKDELDQQVKDDLQGIGKQMGQKLAQLKCFVPFKFSSSTVPEPNTLDDHKRLEKKLVQALNNTSPNQRNFPFIFFLFCMKHLNRSDSPLVKSVVEKQAQTKKGGNHSLKKILTNLLPSKQNIMFALKCSISLGLAVFLGLLYDKQQGYWSGLTIAVSFVTRKQATFSTSNARAQGTALGSIYGVLGCFIFHKFQTLKLASLLPWIIFTTFLRHSKLYGEAGGVSAVVGALLILGRRNYGTPAEFAIARTTEACIGLFCMIVVEVLMRPERAANLAKAKLASSLLGLKDLITDLNLQNNSYSSKRSEEYSNDKMRKLQEGIRELKDFIEEAKVEPNFWYTPFQGASYTSLLQSITKMVDLLYFMAGATELLNQESQKLGTETWKDYKEQLEIDLEYFKIHMSASLEQLGETTITKKLEGTPPKQQKEDGSTVDLETGQSGLAKVVRILGLDEVEAESIISSYLQHAKDLTESKQAKENDKFKKKMILNLGSVGYGMQCLMEETREMEKVIREMVRKDGGSS